MLLASVFTCLLAQATLAADPTTPKKFFSASDKDETAFQFYDLAERKASLVIKIGALQKEIKNLEEEKIPEAKRQEIAALQAKTRLSELERRESDLKNQLKEVLPPGVRQADATTTAKRQSILEELSAVQAELKYRQLKVSEAGGNESTQELRDQLSKKKQELVDAEKDLNSVQRDILKITTPEQSFKARISVYSSWLIGFVILGFFVTALCDAKVRQSVFAGQAGIQFLALFSIIIAIILFGITGILGGNELAALLGSISGYILGKVTTPNGTASAALHPIRIAAAPDGLRVLTGKTGEIDVSCSQVPGAESYVWSTKRAGASTFDRAKTTSQPQVKLSGFGSNEQIEVKVAAANTAGEGPPSDIIAGTAGA